MTEIIEQGTAASAGRRKDRCTWLSGVSVLTLTLALVAALPLSAYAQQITQGGGSGANETDSSGGIGGIGAAEVVVAMASLLAAVAAATVVTRHKSRMVSHPVDNKVKMVWEDKAVMAGRRQTKMTWPAAVVAVVAVVAATPHFLAMGATEGMVRPATPMMTHRLN